MGGGGWAAAVVAATCALAAAWILRNFAISRRPSGVDAMSKSSSSSSSSPSPSLSSDFSGGKDGDFRGDDLVDASVGVGDDTRDASLEAGDESSTMVVFC